MNEPFLKAFGGFSPDGKTTYRLYYDPEDEGVAQDVDKAMGSRLRRVGQRDGPPTYHIVILSDATDRAWTEDLFSAVPPGKLICVVATDIRLRDAQLRRYQWVDYRNRSVEQLHVMSNYLSAPDKARSWSGLRPVPQSLEKPVLPPGVSGLSGFLAYFAVLSFATGVVALLALIGVVPSGAPSPPWWEVGAIGVRPERGILGLGIGALLWWLRGPLRGQGVTYRTVWVARCIGWVAMLVCGGFSIARLLLPSGPGLLAGIGELIVLPLAIVWGANSDVRDWLPREMQRRGSEESLASPAPHVPSLTYAVTVVGIVLAVVGQLTEVLVE